MLPTLQCCTRNMSSELKAAGVLGLTSLPPSCADCVHILGASTSWRHKDLSRTVQREFFTLKYFLNTNLVP